MTKSIEEIVKNFKDDTFFKGTVLEKEPMFLHTTMKVGGNASLFLEPLDINSAVKAVLLCKKENIPFFILGNGSNVIFSDSGYNGIVISVRNLNSISVSRGTKISPCSISLCPHIKESCPASLSCECGTLFDDINKFCEENALLGLESFSGLPATAGGAAYMNARCYSVDASSIIDYVEYADLDELCAIGRLNEFNEKSTDNIECFLKMYHNIEGNTDWSYKHSPFTGKNIFITKVVFKVRCVMPELHLATEPDREIVRFIHKENEKFRLDRVSKGHYKAPSAGSVFKNNRDFGSPSGKLIDDAGLRGLQIGGAQIAPWHGNFIINQGNAKSADIENLVCLAKEKVFEQTGHKLECEILFIQNMSDIDDK